MTYYLYFFIPLCQLGLHCPFTTAPSGVARRGPEGLFIELPQENAAVFTTSDTLNIIYCFPVAVKTGNCGEAISSRLVVGQNKHDTLNNTESGLDPRLNGKCEYDEFCTRKKRH